MRKQDSLFEMPGKRSDSDARTTGSRRPPPDYSSRKSQLRLFIYVAMLMLVIVLAAQGGKWMLGGDAPEEVASERDEPIDPRLPTPEKRLQSDEIDAFLSVADEDDRWGDTMKKEEPGTGDEGAEEKGANPQDEVEQGEQGESPREGESPANDSFPEIPSGLLRSERQAENPLKVNWQLLDAVRDDTSSRRAEIDAWYHLSSILQDTPLEKLQSLSEPRVGYIAMFRQSADYRGLIVTVSGAARRVELIEVPKNDYGIEKYSRVWLQTRDSDNPIVVFTLDLPEGFPVGEDVHAPVEFTGFFFKRWAYDAKGGLMRAPLVLAKIGVQEPPAAPLLPVPRLSELAIVAAGLAVVAMLTAWGAYMVNRKRAPLVERYSPVTQGRREELSELTMQNVLGDPKTRLAQMAAGQSADAREAEAPLAAEVLDDAKDSRREL